MTIHSKESQSLAGGSPVLLSSQRYKLQPERRSSYKRGNIRAERRYQMILSFMLQSHSSSREIQQGDGPEREKSVYFPLCMSACVFGDNSWLISPFKQPRGTQSVNKQRPAKLLLHSFFAPASLLKKKKPLFTWLITPHHTLSPRSRLLILPPTSQRLSWLASSRRKCKWKTTIHSET